MRTSQLRSRQGFTLIELLVVIAIIAILASMVIPAIGLAQDNANTQASAKNMRGIVEVLISYTNDEGLWPSAAASDGSGGATPESWADALMDPNNKANAHLATVGAFGIMMLAYPSAVSNKLFSPKSCNTKGPTGKPEKADMTPWGWTGINKIPYGFDWSAPSIPAANRVWVGDRSHLNIKKSKAIIVFGDGHYEAVTVDDDAPTGDATTGHDSATASGAVKTALFEGAGETDDNVWDNNNDNDTSPDDSFLSAGGSEIRVHLK